MPRYKGKYYTLSIVKANEQYECPISKRTIERGSYYLNIMIEANNQPQYLHYMVTDTYRVHPTLWGNHTIEQILDLTGAFKSELEKLYEKLYLEAELMKRDNELLKLKNDELKAIIAELDKRIESLQILAYDSEESKPDIGADTNVELNNEIKEIYCQLNKLRATSLLVVSDREFKAMIKLLRSINEKLSNTKTKRG